MGLFDKIGEAVFGGTKVPNAKPSGAFPKKETHKLGEATVDYLTRRLTTPVQETPEFAGMSEALRDYLTRASGASRQRLSDAAVAGGWFDSGARISGLTDIDRSELESYSGGLRDIMLELEQRKLDSVLPFLSGASNESMQVQQMLIAGASLREQGRQFNVGATSNLLGIGSQEYGSFLWG